MTRLPCGHLTEFVRGRTTQHCGRCADDDQMRMAGFRGYEECPADDCPTPYLCSERGSCPKATP